MKILKNLNLKIITFIVFLQTISVVAFAQNPFLRPGSNRPKPVIQKPTPTLPPPKPQNTNIELRGFFKFRDQWYFSIFDKAKNKGVWLKKGETFDDGKVEIESFNPDTEVLKMKGGITLSLKKSDNKVLSVPSAMPVKKPPVSKSPTSNKPKIPPRVTTSNGVRTITSGGRTITIPPRNTSVPPKK